jgi:hypothetical protein
MYGKFWVDKQNVKFEQWDNFEMKNNLDQTNDIDCTFEFRVICTYSRYTDVLSTN